jgi:hypothetical protein
MIDKPSVFDQPEWLNLPSVEDDEFRPWADTCTYVMTKLARLTSYVRRVRESPQDEMAASKAINLAEDLLTRQWNVCHVHVW